MKSPRYHIGQQVAYDEGDDNLVVGKISEIHFDKTLDEWVYVTTHTKPLPEGYLRLTDLTEESVKCHLAHEGRWIGAGTFQVR